MFVDSMDCFLTYNLSCINGTFAQINVSSVIVGDPLNPNLLDFTDSSTTSTNQVTSHSILISLEHCIITVIILGGIILSTITGNILVIAAVILEKSLHSVAYYLFVSLAVADLMVASMVMPIAVLKEVTRSWTLGSVICDIWVMIDLLCCTASILHLVAIALDRYWAITNLDYATKRTPGRVLILIIIIWMTAIIISSSHLFPVFRDKRGRPPDQCHLIGTIPFTIISTVGAFHIPLIGMCIIYWKIFQAAKFRIRRKAFNSTQLTSTILAHRRNDTISSSQTITPENNVETRPMQINRLIFFKKLSSFNNHLNDIETDNRKQYSSTTRHNSDYQLKQIRKTHVELRKEKFQKKIHFNHEDNEDKTAYSLPSSQNLIQSHDTVSPINTIQNPLATSNSSPSNSPHFNDTRIVLNDQNNSIRRRMATTMNRKKIDIKRERKATKVLGVVMGCFILCWLPFFIEETITGLFRLTINEKVMSVLTWLGYLNSLLNPVIYTIFAPDFRQAFGKILFGKYRKRTRIKR